MLVLATLSAVAALGLATARSADGPVAASDSQRYAPHTDGLSELLANVDAHPGLRAAAAAAEAAALRVGAVRSPASFNFEVSLQRLAVEPASDPLPPPFDELFEVDERSQSASLSVLMRPFVLGDLRDLLDQRQIDLERAELALREARAGLEARALRAAAGVLLAERGVTLARDGEALAEQGLQATRTRHGVGAASDIELRRAELALADAERGRARAERQLASAEAGLRQLAGEARLQELPALEPVLGPPPELIRAALDVALAEVGARNQARGLLPTAQAGYTWLFDDGDSLTLGLESRTLQPALTYATGSGAGAAGGVGGIGGIGGIPDDVGDLDGAFPTVRGSFTVGISWSFSPQAALEREASERQVEAAIAALAAAHDRATLRLQSDIDALALSRDALYLAELERTIAADEAAAAARRYETGVISPLERDQALLSMASAELAWWSSRVDHFSTVLDTYVAYAIPLSEVLE